jgi:hypothetical protein
MLVVKALVLVVDVGPSSVDFAVGAAPAGKEVDERWYDVTPWQCENAKKLLNSSTVRVMVFGLIICSQD